jgi:arylsulfatase A-like enzyme
MKRNCCKWFKGIIGTVSLLVAVGRAPAAAGTDRPNILWLVSEDNNPFMGCYGDKLADTPTLDHLASQGVLYERCYAWPVCAPSRFTLITGMYPVSCGPAQNMRAQGKIPAWLQGFPALLRQAGYYTCNNAKTDYNSPINIQQAWDESSRRASYVNRPDPEQPFFSVFNDGVTHESCLFPEKELKLDFPPMDPAKVRIPPYQPDTPEMRADWARYYNHMRLMDEHVAQKLKELKESGQADNTIIFYYGDNGGVLPRSKRFLEYSGTHVPLIVYYPPKWRHLAPAPPGSRITTPVSFVDFAPTVLSLAGVKIPDYMQGRAFAGPARGTNQYVFITRDRMDERYDMMRSVGNSHYLYIHNFRPDLPYVQPLAYMFRARGYQSWARMAAEGKLTAATEQFWGSKPTEELYDLDTDPDNVNNLAGDPGHRQILEAMRAELKRRVLEYRDNGFIPEGSALQGYDASRQPGAYPVERVFETANLVSFRDPGNLPKLIAALDDPSEPVRWWGAQGCTMLGQKALLAEAALKKHLDDPSGAVQVAAAEALARLGRTDLALPALERCLRDSRNPCFALQSANVLDRLGESSRPALPTLRTVLDNSDSTAKEPSAVNYLRKILTHTIALLDGKVQPLAYPSR